MNCGKSVFSRVARVCKNDGGGSRSLNAKWTSFIKARLNCSVPGNYPFYFDEIQDVSKLIKVCFVKAIFFLNKMQLADESSFYVKLRETYQKLVYIFICYLQGNYGDKIEDIIYGVFRTAPNSIPGSAVCAFSMRDISKAFDGQFKAELQQSFRRF